MVEPSAVSASRSTRTPSLSSLNDPPPITKSVSMPWGRSVHRVDHVDRPVQERLVQRAGGAELDLEIAGQLVDRRAQQRLQELEIQVAADLAGELPRVAVEPPVRAQVAAVGGKQHVVEIDALPAHGDVDRLGGGLTRTRWTVVSPSAPSTGARDRQRQLLQQQIDRQRLSRRDVDGDPAGGDAAAVAERRQLGRQGLERDAVERQLAVHRRAGRRQRHRGVDVEAIEEVADVDAGALSLSRRRADRDRRQGQVRVAEPDAARADPAQRDVARQHRALGRAGDVQLGAGGAGQRDVGRRPGRAATAERQLVEHHLDVQLLVGRARRCRPRPARRHRSAPGAGA